MAWQWGPIDPNKLGASAAPVISSGTYYVDPVLGSDTIYEGTLPDQAFATIGKAMSLVGAGDTILLRQGSYQEPCIYLTQDNLLIANYNGETPTLSGTTAVQATEGDRRSLIDFNGTRNVRVQGLVFAHQMKMSYATTGRPHYYINMSGTGNLLTHCSIFGASLTSGTDVPMYHYRDGDHRRGIYISGSSCTVSATTFKYHDFGIEIGTQYSTGGSNHIIDCYMLSAQNCHVVVTCAYPNMHQHNVIERCHLEGSDIEDGIQAEPYYGGVGGATADSSNKFSLIRNTLLINNSENQIDLKGSNHWVIEKCLSYGSSGDDDGSFDGPDDWGGASYGADAVQNKHVDHIFRHNIFYDGHCGLGISWSGCHIYNNTVVANNRDSFIGTGSTYDYPVGFSINGWRANPSQGSRRRSVINNIFANHRKGEAAFVIYNDDYLEADYNHYYNFSDVGGATFVHRIDGTTWESVSGLHNWKLALATSAIYDGIMGGEVHSTSGNPSFVSVPNTFALSGRHTAYDFSLNTSSPASASARYLTTATTTQVTLSDELPVEDAGYFFGGFTSVGYSSLAITGDTIKVGSNSPVGVNHVDYDTNTLTLDREITWSAGDPVYMWPYGGSAPNKGAIQDATGGSSEPSGGTVQAAQFFPFFF